MKKFGLFFLTYIVVFSCAIESTPTGGNKDTTPPRITKTIPQNLSTGFKTDEVEIHFDEYVVLKNFDNQFAISPPLDHKVKQTLKGKKLILEQLDSLKPNTTYTLSFGNAIQDLTEGNAQTSFKYVFSTGDYLDSSSVHGFVYNAFTGLPEPNLLAALYPVGEDDSLPYNEKPLYYDLTDENGAFSIHHIKGSAYELIVFEDQNFDFKLSSRDEKKGFLEKNIHPDIDSNIILKAFKETKHFKVYGIDHLEYGKLQINLSTSLENYNTQIHLLNYPEPPYINPDESKDTLELWFNPSLCDSLLEIQITHSYSGLVDTFFIESKNKETKPFKVGASKPVFTPKDSMFLIFNKPLTSFSRDSITFVVNNDTLSTPPLIIDANDSRHLFVQHPIVFGENYQFHFLPGAFTNYLDERNDTSNIQCLTKKEEDYAFLILEVNYKNETPGIIQLIDEQRNVVFTHTIHTNRKFEIPHLDPGKYTLRLIEDSNDNGRWDSGDFYKKRQAEKVYYYNDAIDLRANWEIDVLFNVGDL